jgi:hypothetical protein
MAEWLTPKSGTLTKAVDQKMHLIDSETKGNGADKHKQRIWRRDIDGGLTAGDLLWMSESKSNCKAQSETAFT